MAQKQLVEVVDKNGVRTRRWKNVENAPSADDSPLRGLTVHSRTLTEYKQLVERYHDPDAYGDRVVYAVDLVTDSREESMSNLKSSLDSGEVVSVIDLPLSAAYGTDITLDFDGREITKPYHESSPHGVVAWAETYEGIVYADPERFACDYVTAEGETKRSYFQPIDEYGNRIADGVLQDEDYRALSAGHNKATEVYSTTAGSSTDAAEVLCDLAAGVFDDDDE